MNTVGVFLVRTSGVTLPEIVDVIVEAQARPPLGLTECDFAWHNESRDAERDREQSARTVM